MLSTSTLMGFIATADRERAREFYVGRLGLQPVGEDQFALVVQAGASAIRIVSVGAFTPMPFTVLGWEVADIAEEVAGLIAAGVEFARYSFLEQDGTGIWTAPGGDRIAWFQDPDGNVLSLTQHGSAA
jgi:catechol 2,3-dioxygenase-like lactoylglutathione lyase family enzyme